MNHINLVGRICRTPEVKEIGNDNKVINFTMAVDRKFKNKNGEKEADFIPVVFFGKAAGIIEQYFHKGDGIGVGGRLQVRNYENKEGKKVYVTEVIGEDFFFLPAKKSGNEQAADTNIDSVKQLNNDPDFVLMDDSGDVPF